MLKYYIKTALRNFQTNKVIFVGSLATLCLGALCISLLFSYVRNELTMDDFHKREKDIYIMTTQASPESGVSAIEGSLFKQFNYKDYPEIEDLVTIKKYPKGYLDLIYNNLPFSSEGIVVDSSFFKVFDFKLKIGNKKTALNDPNSIVLTENFAVKLFGNQNPIGKKITVDTRSKDVHTVVGILNPIPSNSSITFDFILPSSYIPGERLKYSRSGADFLLVNKKFDLETFAKKIEKIGHSHFQFTNSKMSVTPLNVLYFNKNKISLLEIISRFGDEKAVYTLIAIMIVILMISALNFSNLQIINTNTRFKHNAIYGVNGAQKHHLVYQKLVEVFLLLGLCVIIITGLYRLIIPFFNSFTGVQLSPPIWEIVLMNGIILILFTFLATAYPIIIALRHPIVKGLKSLPFLGSNLTGRKAIIIFQYSLTFMLLISSIIVVKQLDMMLNKDLGFTSKNIINVVLIKEKQESISQYIKNELKSHSSILAFSQGQSPISPFLMPWKKKGGTNEYSSQNILSVNIDYNKVFGLKIIEGRFFEPERDQSRGKHVVINEAAKKHWGIDDINNTSLLNKFWDDKDGYHIIGVVKDFNHEHLSSKPKPLMMLFWDDLQEDYLIQFQEGKTQEGLEFIEKLFNEINPKYPFIYTFLSDEIAALYQKEKRLSTIYILFTIIALLISAIGLFTIALYDTQRRTKEIGVRKVNGATINEIILMLNNDFVKWVGIAFVIACPVAYYAMSTWLENFAYKTSLSWWVFVLAGVFTLVIALLTVSWQSYRAATRNPVEALRDE